MKKSNVDTARLTVFVEVDGQAHAFHTYVPIMSEPHLMDITTDHGMKMNAMEFIGVYLLENELTDADGDTFRLTLKDFWRSVVMIELEPKPSLTRFHKMGMDELLDESEGATWDHQGVYFLTFPANLIMEFEIYRQSVLKMFSVLPAGSNAASC